MVGWVWWGGADLGGAQRVIGHAKMREARVNVAGQGKYMGKGQRAKP